METVHHAIADTTGRLLDQGVQQIENHQLVVAAVELVAGLHQDRRAAAPAVPVVQDAGQAQRAPGGLSPAACRV